MVQLKLYVASPPNPRSTSHPVLLDLLEIVVPSVPHPEPPPAPPRSALSEPLEDSQQCWTAATALEVGTAQLCLPSSNMEIVCVCGAGVGG